MSTRLILVRHGETTGNAEGRFCGQMEFPLSDRGRWQAERTAKALKAEPVTVIYSSDMIRAAETAAPIAARLGLEVQLTPQLRERNMGDLHGLTFEDVRQCFPEQYQAIMRREADAIPPNGESHRQMYQRVSTEFDQILSRHRNEYLLIVAHGIVLHHIFRHIVGAKFDTDGPQVAFTIGNCTLNRLELTDYGYWRIISINDDCHLKGAD